MAKRDSDVKAKTVKPAVQSWKPCREALGLWWCEWSDYTPGEHTLAARSRAGNGIPTVSAGRRFSVA